MTVTGTEKVGERDAYVLEATSAEGDPDKSDTFEQLGKIDFTHAALAATEQGGEFLRAALWEM